MNIPPAQLTIDEWRAHYRHLCENGLNERPYGGPLDRHADAGDKRLYRLLFDNSAAALALWNLILTEEERLRDWRQAGNRIVGTMKDLGTTPVLAYAFDNLAAFYPDAAWWIPCFKQQQDRLFDLADQYGMDATFCPVRAMIGAFVNGRHFPVPDALVCSVGAVCDDFSIAAAKIQDLGHEIFWWEIPFRRMPCKGEPSLRISDSLVVPENMVVFVSKELKRVADYLQDVSGQPLSRMRLKAMIRKANRIRRILQSLRVTVYASERCLLPSLEMMMAEMLAIHFCSDPEETEMVLTGILNEVKRRQQNNAVVLPDGRARVFWVNPPADLYAMNLLEQCGGRLCGTDFMFGHALATIEEGEDEFIALAKSALADPMIGSAQQRAEQIIRDIHFFGAEAVVVCRIPGAGHCATEGKIISECLQMKGFPVVEIEIPTLIDSFEASLKTRLEALIETVNSRRES